MDKYKAWFVGKGFLHIEVIDFIETSLIVKPITIRVMFTSALFKSWDIKQIDVNNSFLNGILIGDVYMVQPPSFEQGQGWVCKFKKAFYGLKQALRAWFDQLNSNLLQLGFDACKSNTSLFVLDSSSYSMVLVYVDDILIIRSSTQSIQSIISKLDTLNCFLGIEVVTQRELNHLNKKKYSRVTWQM